MFVRRDKVGSNLVCGVVNKKSRPKYWGGTVLRIPAQAGRTYTLDKAEVQ